MSEQASNVAIVHKTEQERITFVGIPSQETTRYLRSIGFDFNRGGGYWFRNVHDGMTTDESKIVATFR